MFPRTVTHFVLVSLLITGCVCGQKEQQEQTVKSSIKKMLSGDRNGKFPKNLLKNIFDSSEALFVDRTETSYSLDYEGVSINSEMVDKSEFKTENFKYKTSRTSSKDNGTTMYNLEVLSFWSDADAVFSTIDFDTSPKLYSANKTKFQVVTKAVAVGLGVLNARNVLSPTHSITFFHGKNYQTAEQSYQSPVRKCVVYTWENVTLGWTSHESKCKLTDFGKNWTRCVCSTSKHVFGPVAVALAENPKAVSPDTTTKPQTTASANTENQHATEAVENAKPESELTLDQQADQNLSGTVGVKVPNSTPETIQKPEKIEGKNASSVVSQVREVELFRAVEETARNVVKKNARMVDNLKEYFQLKDIQFSKTIQVQGTEMDVKGTKMAFEDLIEVPPEGLVFPVKVKDGPPSVRLSKKFLNDYRLPTTIGIVLATMDRGTVDLLGRLGERQSVASDFVTVSLFSDRERVVQHSQIEVNIPLTANQRVSKPECFPIFFSRKKKLACETTSVKDRIVTCLCSNVTHLLIVDNLPDLQTKPDSKEPSLIASEADSSGDKKQDRNVINTTLSVGEAEMSIQLPKDENGLDQSNYDVSLLTILAIVLDSAAFLLCLAVHLGMTYLEGAITDSLEATNIAFLNTFGNFAVGGALLVSGLQRHHSNSSDYFMGYFGLYFLTVATCSLLVYALQWKRVQNTSADNVSPFLNSKKTWLMAYLVPMILSVISYGISSNEEGYPESPLPHIYGSLLIVIFCLLLLSFSSVLLVLASQCAKSRPNNADIFVQNESSSGGSYYDEPEIQFKPSSNVAKLFCLVAAFFIFWLAVLSCYTFSYDVFITLLLALYVVLTLPCIVVFFIGANFACLKTTLKDILNCNGSDRRRVNARTISESERDKKTTIKAVTGNLPSPVLAMGGRSCDIGQDATELCPATPTFSHA